MHQIRSFLAISGGRFIFEFLPPEFLEKYFQPKRSPNSPAPVKKSKKSRPRGTPLRQHLEGKFHREHSEESSIEPRTYFNQTEKMIVKDPPI